MRSDLFASPDQPGSIAAATQWMEALLRGQLATTIAVLAIAIIGYEMFAGRISVRRALSVVLGCFILFGSTAIARGVFETARGSEEPLAPHAFVQSIPPPPLPAASPETNANPFDPYSNNAPPN